MEENAVVDGDDINEQNQQIAAATEGSGTEIQEPDGGNGEITTANELPLPEADDDKATWPKGFGERLKREAQKRESLKAEVDSLKQLIAKTSSSENSSQFQQSNNIDGLSQPKRENFEDDADFVRAVNRYDSEIEKSKNLQQNFINNEINFRKKFDNSLKEGNEKFNDFDDRVSTLLSPDFPSNRAMAEAIVDSEYKSDILYFLGSYPDEAKKIALMNPIHAVKKIAELEIRYADKNKNKNNISNAPRPIDPVNSNKGASFASNPGKMNPEQFREWYESKFKR